MITKKIIAILAIMTMVSSVPAFAAEKGVKNSPKKIVKQEAKVIKQQEKAKKQEVKELKKQEKN
ncbi:MULTISPECIES: hypothetical protein [Clostridium]|uniref:Uncharacterized protein n=1 Tax=Clostridium aquiflavi TaxID=3073603 RepID=A0ABU1EI84_9CLOT|nr:MULTISPECIES: hypothetical protein [unclassified Clostridium]MDR5588101.1 hypothetical protein [Clostridium sp. 5N-1]NFG62053.1 hypothetical protein [Clostridium botulinum]NFQ10140.1 hypothetical protein [Clostridium botulinum]